MAGLQARGQGAPVLDLRDYLRVLRRSWVLIAAFTAAGLLISGGAVLLTKPSYTANTQLFVAIQNSGTVQELQQGNIFTQARVQSYVKTVETPLVLQPAIDSLGLDVTAQDLATHIKATNDVNTVLITIAATDSSPVQAAAIAQAVSDSLVTAVDSLEKPRIGGESPVRLSVVTPAVAPSTPSAPNARLILILGLILGLLAGVALAVLRALLDTRLRGEADVRRVSDAPILGGIAFDTDASTSPLLSQISSQSPRAESFRQLRTNLQFANISGAAKSVLITSSLPGEGKSTIATNLAIALAKGGQSVCLIDADLRRPMVNEYLGLDRNAGLTSALIGTADVEDLLQAWGEDQLYVLTSGQIPPNPSELLGSAQMTALLERLEQTFDIVIIDAPPLLPVTDAAVLGQSVGGVMLIAGVQKVRRQDLERSLNALSMVGVDILGVVLNRLPVKGPDAYAYSYYASETGKQSIAPRQRRRATDSSDTAVKVSDTAPLASFEPVERRQPSTFPRPMSRTSSRND